jgi:hypothetical protein
VFERLEHVIWLAEFELEGRRECHAAHGRHLRSAACSIGLALLSLTRWAA